MASPAKTSPHGTPTMPRAPHRPQLQRTGRRRVARGAGSGRRVRRHRHFHPAPSPPAGCPGGRSIAFRIPETAPNMEGRVIINRVTPDLSAPPEPRRSMPPLTPPAPRRGDGAQRRMSHACGRQRSVWSRTPRSVRSGEVMAPVPGTHRSGRTGESPDAGAMHASRSHAGRRSRLRRRPRNRATCGSWSLACSRYSALTCTMSNSGPAATPVLRLTSRWSMAWAFPRRHRCSAPRP